MPDGYTTNGRPTGRDCVMAEVPAPPHAFHVSEARSPLQHGNVAAASHDLPAA